MSAGSFRLGVNLAGAEFAMIGGKWHWPLEDNLRYYLGKGFNVFRVPFKWNRLQLAVGGSLEIDAFAGLDALIRTATGAGAVILLDAHDYGRRGDQIIAQTGSSVDAGAFADFWGLMARRYKANGRIWYNLMNEPHDEDPMANLAAQNAACAAIRAAGATSKVLFSGSAWTGAHSWLKTANAKVMLLARDPGNNYAFDAHQYLDKGYGGGTPVAIPGVGARVLNDIYGWARQNGKKIFLGEFGTGPSAASLAELDALLSFMVRHKDVFIGATYFAGGGTWGKSMSSTDPVDGIEKPQTLLLQRYL
ncbi:glycoside hydrolase family 5 protein [Sphingomonas sp. HMP9]|uniref:glycoside hydrolase family 5 protein n=1 Tax=Sphingomonas sp. HMP9 TaxID=1517554 RepID=UPI001E516E65|nr:cellulase family glycosylhydrolase [Sphingomonas sp. HMP9]